MNYTIKEVINYRVNAWEDSFLYVILYNSDFVSLNLSMTTSYVNIAFILLCSPHNALSMTD